MSYKSDCDHEEIALKSFFLGPQSENASWIHELVLHIFRRWYAWRKELYPEDGTAITQDNKLSDLFTERKHTFRNEVNTLLERFEDEVPSFSPRYIGHMLTEISLPALLGHIITLLHNPNNISGEVSNIGLAIEKEAVGALIEMLGYNPEKAYGHFTSGGTVANIEGAMRARSRLYKWVAVAAAAKEKGLFKGDVIEASQLGWDRYYELCDSITESDFIPFHLLESNPFIASRELSRVFETEWLGSVMLVPSNKHYSWVKAAQVLGLGQEAFWAVSTDHEGRMCTEDLKNKLLKTRKELRPVMMVVSVAGTTELGEFDPVDKIQDIINECCNNTWHHVDAAYGGFFATLMHETDGEVIKPVLEKPVRDALLAIKKATSVTIDPHKLGYVPYASGTFICADKRDYWHTKIKAPYIAFDDDTRFEPGPQTLEGSRSAAGAVSTWLTSRVIGLNREGYGRIIERSVHSTDKLAHMLVHSDDSIRVNPAGDSNIITFCVAENGEAISETNRRSMAIYNAFSPGRKAAFVVSKTALAMADYKALLNSFTESWSAIWDADELILIRLVLMNPFFDTVETNISYPQTFVEELTKVLQEYRGEIATA